MKRRMIAAGVAMVLAAAGCSSGEERQTSTKPTATASASPSAQTPALEVAANECTVRQNLADGGQSLTLDTEGKDDDSGDALDRVVCVLQATDAPDFVTQHIDSTRALDGQQTDTWDDYEARWTYHPDDGLQITIIDRS